MSALSHCSRWFPMPSLRECDDVRCSLRLSIPGFPLLSIGSRVMPAAGRQGDSKLSQRRGLEIAHLCRVAFLDRISESRRSAQVMNHGMNHSEGQLGEGTTSWRCRGQWRHCGGAHPLSLAAG